MLDILVQSKRDRSAALKLLLKRQGYAADSIVTDRLRSYGAAQRVISLADRHVTGGRSNNRAEVSHQPTRRRERQNLRLKSPASAQRFLASHAAMANHFNVQRHLSSRRTLKILRAEALAAWRQIVAAWDRLPMMLPTTASCRDSALASHATVYNRFDIGAHLVSSPTLRHFRARAFRAWAEATRAA